MGEDSLIKRIDEVSVMLYQNKEEEAMKEMAVLLKIIQETGQKIMDMHKEASEIFIVSTIRELLEEYQQKDMLAMADCLQQKVLLMAELGESA